MTADRKVLIAVLCGVAILGVSTLLSRAGDLNPPAGVIASTGVTLQELSDQIAGMSPSGSTPLQIESVTVADTLEICPFVQGASAIAIQGTGTIEKILVAAPPFDFCSYDPKAVCVLTITTGNAGDSVVINQYLQEFYELNIEYAGDVVVTLDTATPVTNNGFALGPVTVTFFYRPDPVAP